MERHIAFTIPDYTGTDQAAMEKQTDAILASHEALIHNLVEQFSSGRLDATAQAHVAHMLGDLRTRNASAITVLIVNIGLTVEVKGIPDRLPRWCPRPAEEALVKIGKPASQMILDIIGCPKFQAAHVNAYARVLADVELPRYALLKLRTRLDRVNEEEIRKRFESVIAAIEALRLPPE